MLNLKKSHYILAGAYNTLILISTWQKEKQPTCFFYTQTVNGL